MFRLIFYAHNSVSSRKKQELIDSFGERVRFLRKEAGMTIEQLAEKSGLSYIQVSRIERGEASANLNTIGLLAEALEIPVRGLFLFEETFAS